MENTADTVPVTTTAVGLRYGLLLGLSWVILDFLIRAANFSFLKFGIIAGVVAFVLSVASLIFAHAAFKKNNKGLMTYGQGIVISVIVLLISGVFSGVFNYLYVTFIDPDFVERMHENMVAFMESNNVPNEQIEKSGAKIYDMKAGLGKSLLTGITNGLGGGVIFGLIVSAFTKHKQSDFE